MTDYGALLRDHVTLRCRSIDPIFLQAYVPKLQTVGLVFTFLRWQRKFKIPSSAAFGKIGEELRQGGLSVCRGSPDSRRAFQEASEQGGSGSPVSGSSGEKYVGVLLK